MPENVNTSALTLDSSGEVAAPDNRPAMIKVDHVSMVFNMASEQLNSLKEYAIKIARRELFFEGFTALDDISFEVRKGDVFGIIGTNGSGKSTLLKIIAGVLEPTKGFCEISGNIAPLIELGAGFDSELSARENIFLNGALLGYSKAFIDEHFDEIVEFSEIEKFLDMPLKNYSSGMVARIAFAIATVIVPEVLIVDEVLSVGDFMFQKKCEDRITELIEKHGVTVLIVSHSNDQIERLCNKAIWIEKGHTRMLGDAAKVCRVYGGLGGRPGSAESEQRVFDALTRIRDHEEDDFEIITGDDANGINVQLAAKGWENGFDTAVVVSSTSHINAVMAGTLAGALDAPILPTKRDRLPDVVGAALREAKPSRIYYIDCGAHAPVPLLNLKKLPWQPEIIEFTNIEADPFNLSVDIHRHGLLLGIWGHTVMLVDFNDNPESLTAIPLACSMHCPILVTLNEPRLDQIAQVISEGCYDHAIVVGPSVHASVDSRLEQLGLKIDRIALESSQKTVISLCRKTIQRLKDKHRNGIELCAASLSLSQWPELLGSGAYAGRRKAALLLENPADLDDIAQCLDFVTEVGSSIERMTFIGKESGLSRLDHEMLFEALEDARSILIT